MDTDWRVARKSDVRIGQMTDHRRYAGGEMHATAFEIGQKFFELYCDRPGVRILDIGAQDFNGTLRDCAPKEAEYVGVDLEVGPGVDIVLDDPCLLPFEADAFDAVVSTSCFEHNQMFWLAFTEMVRVAKPGGFIYINAPSNGTYHAYPFDNWRFYPDASLALVAWAERQGQPVELIESFIARKKVIWNDCVMVFRKSTRGGSSLPEHLLSEVFSDAFNIRNFRSGAVQNFSEMPEDLQIAGRLGAANRQLEDINEALRSEVEIGRRKAVELDVCRRELNACRHEIDICCSELAAARRSVLKIKGSVSWRLTSPLRFVARTIRDASQRLRR